MAKSDNVPFQRCPKVDPETGDTCGHAMYLVSVKPRQIARVCLCCDWEDGRKICPHK
jgi:hypothetical protein